MRLWIVATREKSRWRYRFRRLTEGGPLVALPSVSNYLVICLESPGLWYLWAGPIASRGVGHNPVRRRYLP